MAATSTDGLPLLFPTIPFELDESHLSSNIRAQWVYGHGWVATHYHHMALVSCTEEEQLDLITASTNS